MDKYDKTYILERLQGVSDDVLLAGLGLNPINEHNALCLIADIDKIMHYIIKFGHKKDSQDYSDGVDAGFYTGESEPPDGLEGPSLEAWLAGYNHGVRMYCETTLFKEIL